ncbi:hypothetical protein RHOFW510R12_01645 [Rhodanobacter sp. FW510-R12]|uniref:MNIO family bufferin maturase n=1 Tax=unclassified Rhodanobacter TaxID=2621553 RepID=UPI0007AA517F|nr:MULTISPECIES: DUF692 domain-containing protein [unclassified Rhodanobacter]KZC16584.1 hypothetical protein RHOFW104R8_14875 [Rhodanobacter sp. FW104-R8]KZC27554.1 hypothetical protein RhoFW510T8_15660 [Rhodanobacter sp. FW510-T8]KZC31804.1 hypothetical protein RhoFW510R10_14730 [Rhodanobacter sp. FW510-R10]
MNPVLPFVQRPVPAAAGIGLRAPHIERVLAERPPVPWFEVHSENYFGAGGAMHAALERIRADYPLSLHGVGLSLGSADALDQAHLATLRRLVDRYEPALVSDHICWGAFGGAHMNELLPLPFTEEALALMVSRVSQVQEALGREFLVENVSSYLGFRDADMPESAFVAELVRRSGCGLLLDVNNIYVNSINHGFDPHDYLRAMPHASVREIHLAGFIRKGHLPVPMLIDSHSRPVADEVWALYGEALELCGAQPTLIEWDQDIPELEVLLAEAGRAEERLHACRTAIA